MPAEAAAFLVRSGMRLEYGAIISQRDAFGAAPGVRIREFEDLQRLGAAAAAALEADPKAAMRG